MSEERLLFGIAVVAVLVSLLAAGLTYFSISDLVSRISGRVSSGEANLTVETIAQINFTTAAASWGSGRITPGGSAASLTTSNHTGPLNVSGGNWTLIGGTTATGMRIENIGNVNVTINFTASKNVTEFIGGTGLVFNWNLSALEANSCLNITGKNGDVPTHFAVYLPANTSPIGQIGCSNFNYIAGQDTLRLDFNLTIPEDSKTGLLTNTITATVTAL